MSSPVTCFSTRNFQLTVTKDGGAWDITGATVTVTFTPPASSGLPAFTRTATVTNGPAGIAGYVTTTADITVPGLWTREWNVTLGPIDADFPAISFLVLP